ncbi:MAG: DUF86 domain-containing protein [Candidatus Thermoplasmatota archaeon]
MIENEIIANLLEIIRKEGTILKRKQNIPFKKYNKDWETQHIVERAFHQAIQACIDIGARIIAQKNFRAARDYHDIFIILSEQKVIPMRFCDKMKEMVGFRNALVHEYRAISHREVYRHLQKSLGIFQEFAKHIIKFLERSESHYSERRKK